jgi:hypothetical protein
VQLTISAFPVPNGHTAPKITMFNITGEFPASRHISQSLILITIPLSITTVIKMPQPSSGTQKYEIKLLNARGSQ